MLLQAVTPASQRTIVPLTIIFKFFTDISLTPHVAGQAGVFLLLTQLTEGGRLVFDQSLLYQIVSRTLKDVQRQILDAALEKATFLFTVFGKLGLFLEDKSLNKLQILCDMYLHILHT